MASEVRERVPGMAWIEMVDADHVATTVDGEREVFSRSDRVAGNPLSGLRHFGPVIGDWRAVQNLSEHIEAAFKRIDEMKKEEQR